MATSRRLLAVVLLVAASGANILAQDPNAVCSGATPVVGCWEVFPSAPNYSAWRRVKTPDGTDRKYKIHGNPALYPTQNAPLVIGFHGYGQSADAYESMTGLTPKADASGFIVAYPEGLALSWNAGVCCGPAMQANITDTAFANEIINDVQRFMTGVGYHLNENKVFATGYSNGGFMSYRLACELPHRIAAVAPVASSMGDDDSDPNSVPAAKFVCPTSGVRTAVPVIHFHGVADPAVPYFGHPTPSSITGAYFRSVPGSTNQWITRNNCSTYHQSYAVGNLTCYTAGLSAASNECLLVPSQPTLDVGRVSLCQVTGGDHSWSGSTAGTATNWMWDLVFSRTQLP